MAVAPTGAIYKTLSFDGASSGDYGVYITGQAVYNAPQKDVEMISIPGRNGAFALDHGRFENIEVTYPAGIFAESEDDFAEAISDFRNWLCSREGYVRLTDDYNPDEYRLAIYKSGLEVEPAQLRAGEFDIVFECKPQRFLTSGEAKVTMVSGNDITNPTLFPSNPMLEVYGEGDINIGSNTITVNNDPIGDIVILGSTGSSGSKTITLDTQFANSGDKIKTDRITYECTWRVDSGTLTAATGSMANNYASTTTHINGTNRVDILIKYSNISLTYGTSKSRTDTGTYTITSSAYGTLTGSIIFAYSYNGASTLTLTVTPTLPSHMTASNTEVYINQVILESSQYALGTPLYIDLDIGEAYKIEGGSVASVNNAVIIPAELPTLAPGNTTITFDNTITKLDIVPRWWKV